MGEFSFSPAARRHPPSAREGIMRV